MVVAQTVEYSPSPRFISETTLAKLSGGESVNTEMLVKICNALRCDFSDIMEMKFDDEIDAATDESAVHN